MAKRDVSPDCTHEISQSGAYSFFWVSIMQHVEFSPMVGINKAWGYQPRSTVISVAATKGRDRTKYTSNPTKTSLHGYESWGPVGVSDYIIYIIRSWVRNSAGWLLTRVEITPSGMLEITSVSPGSTHSNWQSVVPWRSF